MAVEASQVRGIRSEEDLYGFLRDDLGWPVETGQTFPFYADELGLTQEASGKIGSVRQIAPFVDGQPWGIFLVEYDGNRNRISRRALRRVLRGLSETRRDRAAQMPAWKADNLLFLCTRNFRDFEVARFAGDTHTRATLSVFEWEHDDPGLRTVCEYNLDALRYPDDPANGAAWLQSWARAFDVKAVTDRFFKHYRDVFSAFEDGLQAQIPEKEARRLFTQSLFNRLMFCWFLQKKGWLYREKDYLRNRLRDAREMGTGPLSARANFYADYLRPLFFEMLNTPHGERPCYDEWNLLEQRLGDVPFLNGGLFAPHPQHDKPGAVTIRNDAFAPVFDLFAGHNFTVAESTPLEIEVAVDPEMLGKVFEELVTGRHESGSYYTPRPVVAFMCREALKGYLHDACPTEVPDEIAAFVDGANGDKAENLRKPEAVFDALRRIKVCDPACGSGAYLLGMMQELLRLRQSLFASKVRDHRQVYDRKLEIIQRNLYGVDIDGFAVNIAMLRLWLSLIVDDGRSPLDDLPRPNVSLPNLKFKITQGDSLASVDPSCLNMFGEVYAQEAGKLQRLHDEYFAPPDEEQPKRPKSEIEADIERQQGAIADLIGSNAPKGAVDWCAQFAEVFAEQEPVTTIGGAMNMGQGELTELPEPGGFDIVLANPPYIRQELITAQKPMLKAIFSAATTTGTGGTVPGVFNGTADLYTYFYARAIQLLRPGGMLAFISPDKWFKAGYGANLRRYVADLCSIVSITTFGELPVFENAATFPMIFVARKGNEQTATVFTKVKSLAAPYPNVLALIRRDGQTLPADALRGADWILTSTVISDRFRKMQKVGVPLGEYVNGQIFRGVLTGFNTAFVIDGAKRAELIAVDPKSVEIIKPLAVGDDVRRWRITTRDRWLIVTKIGVDITRYPAIMKHLCQWQPELEKRSDKGDYWWELRACAYYSAFDKPKIIYPVIGKEPRFAFDTSGAFTNDKAFIIPLNNLYLLGVLNSWSAWEYLKSICSVLGDPEKGGRLELRSIYLEKLPIPTATDTEKIIISAFVECLLYLHLPECEASHSETPPFGLMRDYFEQILSGLVYQLYFPEDIEVFAHVSGDDFASMDSMPPHDKSRQLSRLFEKLYDDRHPLRGAMFQFGSLLLKQ